MKEVIEAIGQPGVRLDRFLADQRPDLSRAFVRTLIETGNATVDGKPAKPGLRLSGGERITLMVPVAPPLLLEGENIPIPILYEDEDVLVIDKPAGLVVHPAAGHERGTLVHALLGRGGELAGIGASPRPGIVHRLDKDTSGVLIVAKTPHGERQIARQIQDRQVVKTYLALVEGHPDPPQGRIEAPIGRDPRHRQRMAVVADGREAITDYRTVRTIGPFSLLEVNLITGRTHQIRVHLAAIGHPVAGDTLYGRPRKGGPPRQFLHASRIGFRRPRDGAWIEVESPLPADLATWLARHEPPPASPPPPLSTGND
ncbi:MAG: RluA family pseudouridine synthase [Chloroflexota bacterium]|nr:RluA family pseudouridine synthase [Dehalococcoidia bacterium]MDW8255323.1 RluA family pseudouridine synthase [Chloroflexota bacterium]